MKLGIIGLPNCGKTTVFNALTKGTVQTDAFTSGRLEPNLAAVKVPDPRLEVLEKIYNPKKLTPAEIQYIDVGGFSGSDDRKSDLPAELLNYIGTTDALLHVVRAFEDERVPHPLGDVNVVRDIQALDSELMLSDLVIVERRLERLEKEIRKLPPQDRKTREVEQKALLRIHKALEEESPVRNVELSDEEEKLLRGFQFLSAKPVLLVLNIGEDSIDSPPSTEYPHSKSCVVAMSAKIEAELAQLDDDEAAVFMEELGIKSPARDRAVTASYELLGLISFLTVGEDEVRAWTIKRGTKAPDAGGVIHSDILRGFIRAEVIQYGDLVEAGSLSQGKRLGLVRLEGKEYTVLDGDICNFLFNV